MTRIRYTFVALPYKDDGTEVIHAHISIPEEFAEDSSWKERPRDQRRATGEAVEFIKNVMKGNGEYVDQMDRLFKGDQPIPDEAKRLMMFDLKVLWKDGLPVFKDGGYERWDFDRKYNGVVTEMFEVRDTTLDILRRNLARMRAVKNEFASLGKNTKDTKNAK